jgi:uncharacterized membrane protein
MPSRHNKPLLVVLLAAGSLACLALLLVRFEHTGTQHYRFLLWNLFLAWIPLVLAIVAYGFAETRRATVAIVVVPTAILWLLFFPNAPYILTDFLRLDAYHDAVPQWFDVMLIVWFAWTGLLLGVVSLRFMHAIVARALGRFSGWLFVLLATALGSLGIYLGRFLRWNSWDVFHAPLSMADQVWERVSQPLSSSRLVGFTSAFAAFFLFVYLALYLMDGFAAADGAPHDPAASGRGES